MKVDDRAQVHAALGDPSRLRMIDELQLGDRTFQELANAAGLPGNAAAHHLGVLESAGLIERRVSEGDRRRRYITLRPERLGGLLRVQPVTPATVLFVCTHNSARSQFAAALWHRRTGGEADSAGTHPSERVDPRAVRTAEQYELDLAGARPKGYASVRGAPDLVISVCDRAHEAGLPFPAPSLHWSVPDPVRAGTRSAFRAAFADIAARIDRLIEGERSA
jgi:ArsR family transcriptional regulator, arsenate/arsenite/antimonite-responsive transcriptional repressor / arsenate reductase (thioredoxin)